MIIVLDTNVLISGLLRPHSKPATVLRLVATGVLRVAFDERILAEYREVLGRSKFPFSSDQIQAVLDQIETEGMTVVALPLRASLPDPDDAPFLEVAVTARADVLIAGNTRHYPARARHGISVLDPAAFLDRWSRQPRRQRDGTCNVPPLRAASRNPDPAKEMESQPHKTKDLGRKKVNGVASSPITAASGKKRRAYVHL